jgi:hypothetical protein
VPALSNHFQEHGLFPELPYIEGSPRGRAGPLLATLARVTLSLEDPSMFGQARASESNIQRG